MDLDKRQERLLGFVKKWHGDQKRRYTKEPYWHHLVAVAKLAAKCPYGVEIGLCHDLFEDTRCTYNQLQNKLIDLEYSDALVIVNGVVALTDVYTSNDYPSLNRADRKRLEAERLGKISFLYQSIKYADLIDNTSTIVDYDPEFAHIYLQEKKEIINVMREGEINLLIKCCWTWQNAILKLKQIENY